ncbi:MAG: calcium-binding protein [Prochloraceae cyanobacterium]
MILGTLGNDSLVGTTGADIILGGLGNDTLIGLDGADILFDDVGNNFFDGGNGPDTIIGGSGSDTIQGGSGNDIIAPNISATLDDGFSATLDGVNDFISGGFGIDIFSYSTSFSPAVTFQRLFDGTVIIDGEDYVAVDVEYVTFNDVVYILNDPNNPTLSTPGFFTPQVLDFDPAQYLASHPDIIQAFANPTYELSLDNASLHYLYFGRNEGRVTDNFNEAQYLASNPDLINVFGNNQFSYSETLAFATEHYIQFGFFEGRALNTFNAVSYLNNNPDLVNVFGNDIVAATQHYIQFGFSEARIV